jgi:hypothetical protein
LVAFSLNKLLALQLRSLRPYTGHRIEKEEAMSDDELRAKKEGLTKALKNQIRHEKWWGAVNRRSSMGLIAAAIVASAGAGIAGLLETPPKIVGLISFVPGVLALAATTFNFDLRAKFHHRKSRQLSDLLGRFEYEMPTLPSADQIAIIHRAKTEIEAKTAEDEEKYLDPNWNWVNANDKAKPH